MGSKCIPTAYVVALRAGAGIEKAEVLVSHTVALHTSAGIEIRLIFAKTHRRTPYGVWELKQNSGSPCLTILPSHSVRVWELKTTLTSFFISQTSHSEKMWELKFVEVGIYHLKTYPVWVRELKHHSVSRKGSGLLCCALTRCGN